MQPLARPRPVTALMVVVAALVAGVFVGRPAATPADSSGSTALAPTTIHQSESTPSDERLTVHVSGEVLRAGLVSVTSGARVADAVAAAGGASNDADLTAINLAAVVLDGQQIVVPRVGDDSGLGVKVTDSGGRVRINAADAQALDDLPGVGPVLAASIIAHREQNGPFEVVEDLLAVSGIGEAKLATLRDHVLVP